MRRILLILEDIKEMIFLEGLFRKAKFDVQIDKTNVGIFEKYLAFRPDLVIMTARGKKINGIELAKKMNPKGDGPVILLAISAQAGIRPADLQGPHARGYIESPINPQKAFELIANHLGIKLETIRENLEKSVKVGEVSGPEEVKYVKSKEKVAEEKTWVKGVGSEDSVFDMGDSSVIDEQEPSKYLNHKLLDFVVPKQKFLERDRIQRQVARIRTEGEEPDLDEARKAFVRALYRK